MKRKTRPKEFQFKVEIKEEKTSTTNNMKKKKKNEQSQMVLSSCWHYFTIFTPSVWVCLATLYAAPASGWCIRTHNVIRIYIK